MVQHPPALRTGAPGSSVLRLVEIMDQLRSANGCPWDARQTHETLSEYLLEETYETLAAIEQGDTADLVEELGDLLLQIVFHSRLGQEETPSWDLDDVARGISEKLIRRHPHVYARESEAVPLDCPIPMEESDPVGEFDPASESDSVGQEQLSRNWTRAKAAEKGRSSVLDGIPRAMPALAQAQKTWRRSVESGLAPTAPDPPIQTDDHEQFGEALIGMAIAAERSGIDAEAALRAAIAKLRLEIQELETQETESPTQPGQIPTIESG